MIQKIALRDGLHLEDYAGLALWFTILSRWARGRSSSGAPASAASGAATSGWTVAPSPPKRLRDFSNLTPFCTITRSFQRPNTSPPASWGRHR